MARPLVKMAVDDLHRALTMSAPVLPVVPAALVEAVQEEHREVQRDGDLQDGAGRVGDKGDLAEHQVRARVDEHGHAQARHDQDGLEPRLGGEHQHEQDDDDGYDGDQVDLGDRPGGRHRRGDRRAVHGVVVADDGAHAVDRLDLVPLGHGDREERRGVLVVGLDGVGVLHLEGLADVDGVVEPHDVVDARHGRYGVLVGERLLHVDVAHHDAHVGDALVELGVHDVDGLGGGHALGQVVVEVVVHADERLAQRAHGRRQHEQDDHRLPVLDDALEEQLSHANLELLSLRSLRSAHLPLA